MIEQTKLTGIRSLSFAITALMFCIPPMSYALRDYGNITTIGICQLQIHGILTQEWRSFNLETSIPSAIADYLNLSGEVNCVFVSDSQFIRWQQNGRVCNNPDYLLYGSVYPYGAEMHFCLLLIEPTTGMVLWGNAGRGATKARLEVAVTSVVSNISYTSRKRHATESTYSFTGIKCLAPVDTVFGKALTDWVLCELANDSSSFVTFPRSWDNQTKLLIGCSIESVAGVYRIRVLPMDSHIMPVASLKIPVSTLFTEIPKMIAMISSNYVMGNATLVIDSDPSSAECWVDGQSVGRTPQMLTLEVGNHAVRIMKHGSQQFNGYVHCQQGLNNISISLENPIVSSEHGLYICTRESRTFEVDIDQHSLEISVEVLDFDGLLNVYESGGFLTGSKFTEGSERIGEIGRINLNIDSRNFANLSINTYPDTFVVPNRDCNVRVRIVVRPVFETHREHKTFLPVEWLVRTDEIWTTAILEGIYLDYIVERTDITEEAMEERQIIIID